MLLVQEVELLLMPSLNAFALAVVPLHLVLELFDFFLESLLFLGGFLFHSFEVFVSSLLLVLGISGHILQLFLILILHLLRLCGVLLLNLLLLLVLDKKLGLVLFLQLLDPGSVVLLYLTYRPLLFLLELFHLLGLRLGAKPIILFNLPDDGLHLVLQLHELLVGSA